MGARSTGGVKAAVSGGSFRSQEKSRRSYICEQEAQKKWSLRNPHRERRVKKMPIGRDLVCEFVQSRYYGDHRRSPPWSSACSLLKVVVYFEDLRRQINVPLIVSNSV